MNILYTYSLLVCWLVMCLLIACLCRLFNRFVALLLSSSWFVDVVAVVLAMVVWVGRGMLWL